MTATERQRRTRQTILDHINGGRPLIVAYRDSVEIGSTFTDLWAGFTDEAGVFHTERIVHPFKVWREQTFEQWQKTLPPGSPALDFTAESAREFEFNFFYELITD